MNISHVILSAWPATLSHVILSAIPVYRDEVEERGGIAMPPGFDTRLISTLNTRFQNRTGLHPATGSTPGATSSPHIFRLHSASLRCAQYDGTEPYPLNFE